jgi:hypothetical protein
VPLIDDLRIGGSDHTHKAAHYSDLTTAPFSRNSKRPPAMNLPGASKRL